MSYRGKKHPLYNSMRKYGVENFTFDIIEECSDDIVNDRERHWVAHFDSVNSKKGYNLTTGGNSLFRHTEKTRKLLREKRALQVITLKHRNAISTSLKKTNQLEEVKLNRRNGQAKRGEQTEETKKKRSESHRKWCESNRELMLLNRQKLRRCSMCNQVGHNKRSCKELNK